MSKLYLECFSGISGNMFNGLLIDLGADLNKLKETLNKLDLDGYEIEVKKDSKHHIFGTYFNVKCNDTKAHRHYKDIKELIESSDLDDSIKEDSIKIFEIIAKSEGKIHNISVDEVHFHEVGAIDSIVDIVSACILLKQLDINEIVSTKISLGTGFIECAHGKMMVPAPATLDILSDYEVKKTSIEAELTTPTGAAIIKALSKVDNKGEFKILKTGYGLGTRNLEIPNALRGSIVIQDNEADYIYEIKTNIDDMNSEIYSKIMKDLFELNALDVYYQPVFMKKNRPATLISVLSEKGNRDNITEYLLKNTTTNGVRYNKAERVVLGRELSKFKSHLGEISIKLLYYKNKLIRVTPEYDDLEKISNNKDISIVDVYKIVEGELLNEFRENNK